MGGYFLKKQARSPILEGFGRNIYALLSFSGQQYFSFCFYSFSYTLFSSLGLWFGYGSVFAPCQKAFQKFYFSKKERYFFYLFFVGFPLFFHSFFHSSSQDIPVRERPFSV